MTQEATHHITIEQLFLLGAIGGALFWFIHGFLMAKLTPAPWGGEIERELQDPNALDRAICSKARKLVGGLDKWHF